MYLPGVGPERVAGLVQAPDNVGFPLAKPRFYLLPSQIDARFGATATRSVNYAEVWLRDPAPPQRGAGPGARLQLRPARPALRHPLGRPGAARPGGRDRDRPAGGAVADRAGHRRRDARLLGAGRGPAAAGDDRGGARRRARRRVTSRCRTRSRRRSSPAPAAAIGCAAGVLAIYGPAARLLSLLNEPAPGRRAGRSGARRLARSAWRSPSLGAAWPAWRAARRPVVGLLRGGDVAAARAREATGSAPAGSLTLGGAAGARAARPAGGDRDHARALDRVRAADAVARLGAERAARPIPARSASATS